MSHEINNVSTVFTHVDGNFRNWVAEPDSVWLSALRVTVLGYHTVKVAERIPESDRGKDFSDWLAPSDTSPRSKYCIADRGHRLISADAAGAIENAINRKKSVSLR